MMKIAVTYMILGMETMATRVMMPTAMTTRHRCVINVMMLMMITMMEMFVKIDAVAIPGQVVTLVLPASAAMTVPL